MTVAKWVEYWVSERDQYGDVIDYTAQTFKDRNGAKARKVFDAPFYFDNATSKVLEKVESYGDGESIGDRDYETLATRSRDA